MLEEPLKTATVFKGTLKTVHKELLDCKLSVVRSYIQEEVKNANFAPFKQARRRTFPPTVSW